MKLNISTFDITRCKFDKSWTTLPSLELKGVGTPLVESLNSYAKRLAFTCGISMQQLVQLINIHSSQPFVGFSYTNSSWIGPNSKYKSLLIPLMNLTGQTNLFRGTFHCVSDLLNNHSMVTKNASESNRHWCPKCYLETGEDFKYEPLVWTFTILTSCPVHHVMMESTCNSCGASQSVFTDYANRRICFKCKANLGHEGLPRIDNRFLHWKDQMLCSFVKYISLLDDPIPHSRYERFIAGLFDRIKSGEPLPPLINKYIYAISAKRDFSKIKPSINQYLNFAAFQGVTIEDILESPEQSSALPLFDRGVNFTTVPFLRRHAKANVIKVGVVVRRILELRDLFIPPLRFIIQDFNIHSSVFLTNYPDLHQRYNDRLLSQKSLRIPVGKISRSFGNAFRTLRARSDFIISIAEQSEIIDKIAKAESIDRFLAKAAVDSVIAILLIKFEIKDMLSGQIPQDLESKIWLEGN